MIQIVELSILLVICLYTDLQAQKIKNKYVLPIAILGFVTNIFIGTIGWWNSLLGLILPFVVFFIFFYLRMFRAGDIKEMMAVGAIMGYRFIGNAIFFIFGVGLVIAIFKMIIYGNAKERFQNIGKYFKMLFKTFQVTAYEESGSYDKSIHFPFSIAIGLGSLINLVLEYNNIYIFFKV